MKIYTKGGDQGHTSLIGGERVPKYDLRVEAYGTVDELSAHVAMLRDMLTLHGITEFDTDLIEILRILMSVEALMAIGKDGNDKVKDTTAPAISALETRIDEISALLHPIEKFTIPGGHTIVSQAHICRTICRRAERRADLAASEHELSPNALMYLNRLSDYLYVLGRRLTSILNIRETLWEQ